uniref:G-protein coupled receptors family 1 profile domain-containing protein n=1 Tax=Romanomermis culicivorax TaxID=13658 RepID=A0A915K917_ROMCU
MNSSFSVMDEDRLHRSLEILSAIFPSFVVFMVAGVVATLTGVLSFAAILRSKEMKSKFYALYVEMAVVDFLMGVSYVFTATRKIYRLKSREGDVMERSTCCQESAILYFSQTLGLYVAFTLAIDRTVSFVRPVAYKYLKPVYITLPLIVAAWAFSILETAIMVSAGSSPAFFAQEILISCGTASCWSIPSYFATLYSHLAISGFVVLLNFCLIFVAKSLMKEAIKRKAVSNLTEDERRLRSQNHFQMKVIKTLSVMVVSHATSHISSRLLLVVLLHLYHEDPELTVLAD